MLPFIKREIFMCLYGLLFTVRFYMYLNCVILLFVNLSYSDKRFVSRFLDMHDL